MIFTFLLEVCGYFLDVFLTILSIFPKVPTEILNTVDQFFDYLFTNCSIISFFLPIDFIKIILPLSILVSQSDKIYNIVIWLIKKIPFLGME